MSRGAILQSIIVTAMIYSRENVHIHYMSMSGSLKRVDVVNDDVTAHPDIML